MYLIILCGVIVAYLFFAKGYLDFGEGLFGRLMSLFLGAAIGLWIGFILAIIISAFLPAHFVEVGQIELVSMRGSTMTEGTLFLGSGSIKGKLCYIYYKKTDNGGYQQGMMEVSNSITIFEEERSEGVLKIYKASFDNPWYHNIAIASGPGGVFEIYEFHIPKGSLKKNFILE
ncbi:MAG: hypothetical protein UT05_C0009G0052 [Parcubacteria group bacterium GW2011_GWF2_38_76]|nr:MAG: hypothetical protein UT05_C0009G0052 [Parcubacteria group bacterium GW2011_GWF2_38_76]HBM45493.1 hypothetical protein [Patescibacteria group bacterium]